MHPWGHLELTHSCIAFIISSYWNTSWSHIVKFPIVCCWIASQAVSSRVTSVAVIRTCLAWRIWGSQKESWEAHKTVSQGCATCTASFAFLTDSLIVIKIPLHRNASWSIAVKYPKIKRIANQTRSCSQTYLTVIVARYTTSWRMILSDWTMTPIAWKSSYIGAISVAKCWKFQAISSLVQNISNLKTIVLKKKIGLSNWIRRSINIEINKVISMNIEINRVISMDIEINRVISINIEINRVISTNIEINRVVSTDIKTIELPSLLEVMFTDKNLSKTQ